jgi:hypothetical protein
VTRVSLTVVPGIMIETHVFGGMRFAFPPYLFALRRIPICLVPKLRLGTRQQSCESNIDPDCINPSPPPAYDNSLPGCAPWTYFCENNY